MVDIKIGLIDVDGHNFPNLALMRISSYHKFLGDEVEWWSGDLFHYDIVYKSKVFSDEYSEDIPDPLNADLVIKGGTGYCISLENGKEVFDKEKNHTLPDEIEKMFPDYSIYPQYDFAVSMTSRGCPCNCEFCHVCDKEGCKSVKVADVSDFWNGQKTIKVLDPNITACKDKRDLMAQYIETNATIDFTQGLGIRFVNDDDIKDLNAMRLKNIHFAWDNPNVDLKKEFEYYAKNTKHKPHGHYGTVYCLTNFNSTTEQDLYRIYTLRDMGYDPFVMVYNKGAFFGKNGRSRPLNKLLEVFTMEQIQHAHICRDLQRWVNRRQVFRSCPKFEDYRR